MGLIRKTSETDGIIVAQPAASAEEPQFESLKPEALSTQYEQQDLAGRRAMIKSLAKAPEALAFLVGQARVEHHPLLLQGLFDSVISLARNEALEEQAIHAVLDLLREGNASVRSHSVTFLSAFPKATGAVIPKLLQDENPDTRLYALDVIQHLVHPDVPLWLNDLLEREQHANVMASAIDRCLEAGCTELQSRADEIAERFSDTPFIRFALTFASKRLEGIH